VALDGRSWDPGSLCEWTTGLLLIYSVIRVVLEDNLVTASGDVAAYVAAARYIRQLKLLTTMQAQYLTTKGNSVGARIERKSGQQEGSKWAIKGAISY